MSVCPWLPPLESCQDLSKYSEYEDFLYSIFKDDFIISNPQFEGKPVRARYHPITNEKVESFYHIICKATSEGDERFPDFLRCERIRWVRKFIENYNCQNIPCELCPGIKIWEKPYGKTYRIHILMEKENYIVVLERRREYILLVTAFYLDYPNMLEKKLKEYQKYKK